MFTISITTSFVVMMGIVDNGLGTAIGVSFGVWVLKVTTVMVVLPMRLRPLAQWFTSPKTPDDPHVIVEVAAAAYRAPFTISLLWAGLNALSIMIVTMVLYLGYADSVPLGPRSLEAAALASFATLLNYLPLCFPISEWLMASLVEDVSLAAHKGGVAIRGRGLTIRARLVAFALTLALGPSSYIAASMYMGDARAEQRDLQRQAEYAALEASLGRETAARAENGWVFTFDDRANITGSDAQRVLADNPRLARMFRKAATEVPTGEVAHPREGVIAFRTEGERKFGVVIPRGQSVSFSTTMLILVMLTALGIYAPICALAIARSTAVPVSRVSEALALVGQGEVSEAPKVAVFHQDEVGALAQNYNTMLDQLRLLAHRTIEVSKGALDVEFEARGDLGEAFRGQVASLRDIVGHIAQSAAQLAGAASEMYAAAQEQEAAAQQQSVGVEEVSRTMESLLVAATHVTESTMGVLTRAERTRETTSRTADRITELSAHANRIGEILDTIREIADRSDLLALNASLEGTRAGDAGRGFALVAAEMRKLAERVTASVGDIKKLVSDVRSSVSATVLSTEESSRLAEGTTESARQINLVTQQQRSGTEQAGQSMRDVASMITQSLAATQQVRSLAEDLKVQADNLNTLVARFRLPTRRPEVKT
jgi:methyl-accepting chemotaxis protein